MYVVEKAITKWKTTAAEEKDDNYQLTHSTWLY